MATPPPPAEQQGVAAAPAPWAADVEALAELLGPDLLARVDDPIEPILTVGAGRLVEVARFLRDQRGYQLLGSITAVDWLPRQLRFQVVYHFTALPEGALAGRAQGREPERARLLRVKVPVPGPEPVVASLTGLYPGANWLEREVFDLFGIEFTGHPDLRRILLPEGTEGHPLRKDHPLEYEVVAFSHNEARVHGSKPRAGR
jgi:NADH-quinone oxidoreductase subunit C